MRVLIIGCGYVGLPLGAELAGQGHEVFGLRRSAGAESELKTAGVTFLRGDITRPAELAALPGDYDWVVHCVSSGGGQAEDYRALYLQGTRNVLQWLAPKPPKKFIYTSSTSVYGQTDGSLVKETSPTEPAAETARVLLETERELLEAFRHLNFPAVILRVAGIYGPDRLRLLQQYLKNDARIENGGSRLMNMIHRDDVVGVIQAALRSGRLGEIYNAVDDEPVSQLNYFHWLAGTLGKWPPPPGEAKEEIGRARGLTSKKVSNRRLKMELGYQFRYPNFRLGYTAEILRLDRAGKLDIQPEPR